MGRKRKLEGADITPSPGRVTRSSSKQGTCTPSPKLQDGNESTRLGANIGSLESSDDDEVFSKHKKPKSTSEKDLRKKGSAKKLMLLNADLVKKQKDRIRDAGFGGLLDIKYSSVHEKMSAWLVRIFDTEKLELVIPFRGSIKVDAKAVHRIFGIPMGKVCIEYMKKSGADSFLEFYKLLDREDTQKAPTFEEAKQMLLVKYKGKFDDTWLQIWLLFAVSSLLCPTSSPSLCIRAFHAMFELKEIKNYNWCQLVVDRLVKGVQDFKSGKKFLTGCLFFLTILYLDSLDIPNHVDQRVMPRVSVWTEDKVAEAIALDKLSDNDFGKLRMPNSSKKWSAQSNSDQSKFMALHLSLLDEFLQFCKSKTDNPHTNVNAERPVGCSFKEKLVFYFGENLPPDVIDQLCKLVDENSYGKCHYCALPSESLVLSVLQVLLDACNKSSDTQDCNPPIKAPSLNVANNISASSSSPISREVEAGIRFEHIGEDTIVTVGCPCEFAEAVPAGNQYAHEVQVNGTAVIETELNATIGVQEKTPVAPMKKRSRQLTPLKLVSPQGRKENQTVEDSRTGYVSQYAAPPPVYPICRFPITDQELRYYRIICGLAHSPWRTNPGLKFFKTTVTYQSLGESLEPNGRADNYFIAAVCWKNFEDQHPRVSGKHFFYPRIGVSLLSYSSLADAEILKHSFLGANLAKKLHRCHKLCFPIYHQDHWFVFIVDLENKKFVFLDSYYNQNDMYQIQVRQRLITSFKQCWLMHAEVKLDLEKFEPLYPPVPKQTNFNDCGIFSVLFLERWDFNIDLRHVFDFSDIGNIRVKLANSLFFRPTNSVDKDLVNCFYNEPDLDPTMFT